MPPSARQQQDRQAQRRLAVGAESKQRHPGSGCLPAAGTAYVVDLHETMKPWHDTSPADLLDHTPRYTFDV